MGLLLASRCANIPPTAISTGKELAPIIADRVPVSVIKDGKAKGSRIPAADLNSLVNCEIFLREFQPIDQVVERPSYLGEFVLSTPGYNDHGRGQRIFYVGGEPSIATGTDTIQSFLDVMDFASAADRTNSLAAALTVLLRNYWPGAKPIAIVTATKSHAGKETIVSFMAGGTASTSISYERADWALQQAFVAAVRLDSRIGVVNIENVRQDPRIREISSAFLERFITDPKPLLFSTKVRTPVQRTNDLVLAMTTNFGIVGEDLMNRSLPIHLHPVGDVADRQPAIGNPKLEFLPSNRDQIEAELRGMVERWKRADKPLDLTVRHPFTEWAQVIGGILRVNGFTDFLANYAVRRTVDDPVRKSLGLLGTYKPDQWLSANDWAALVALLGLKDSLIPPADRESPESRRRGLGVVLSAHEGETCKAETDDAVLTLQLEKARRRFGGLQPETRYRFVLLERNALEEDAPSPQPVE
jgi:hypothetical protein